MDNNSYDDNFDDSFIDTFDDNFDYSLWDDYWGTYRINSEAALQIALQQVPGQFTKIELDYDNGTLVYEIDIRTASGEYEVYIDAITGQILRVGRDY